MTYHDVPTGNQTRQWTIPCNWSFAWEIHRTKWGILNCHAGFSDVLNSNPHLQESVSKIKNRRGRHHI